MTTPQKIGRYEILDELGRGAMGAVYRAKDPAMDRIVALKTIISAALASEQGAEFRQRFFREARAAGQLTHPGIVPVFDVGEHDGSPFLVMEYVNGWTLAGAAARGERLDLNRMCEIGQNIAEALGYAHRRGVVHRDIKPANILLTARETYGIERPKITDFGIAKLTEGEATMTGKMLGTPAFMPPEQFTGAPVDGRADIFSLGVVLYWLATGEQPFPGEGLTTVLYKVVHTEPIPPRKLNPSLPARFEGIILRCMEKDPAARFQTAEELARELAEVRAGKAATAAPRTLTPASDTDATLVEPARAAAPLAASAGDATLVESIPVAVPLAALAGDATLVAEPARIAEPVRVATPLASSPGETAGDATLVAAPAATPAAASSAAIATVPNSATASAATPIPAPAASPATPAARPPAARTTAAKRGSPLLPLAAVAAVLLAGAGWFVIHARQKARSQPAAVVTPPPAAPPASAAPVIASTDSAATTDSDAQSSAPTPVDSASDTSPTPTPASTAAPPAATPTPTPAKKPSAAVAASAKSSVALAASAKSSAALAASAKPSAAAPAATPAAAPATPTPPPAAAPALGFDPMTLDPKQNARLTVNAEGMPKGLAFTVEFGGKLYTVDSGGATKDSFAPPGLAELRVTSHSGAVTQTSNAVSAEFKAKKHYTLTVQLRLKDQPASAGMPGGLYPDSQIVIGLK